MAKILLVEDDPMAANMVKSVLEKEGHTAEWAESGEDAVQLFRNFEYELLLLDWNLPGMSGVEVCKEYRKGGGARWVIFMTSMSEIESKEKGLDAGADDYLVKPVDPRELAARVRRVFRRTTSNEFQSELKIHDITLDVPNRAIQLDRQSVRLTKKEAAVLEYLMRNPDVLTSTKKLLNAVWQSDNESSEGAVRTCMHGLRSKLEGCGRGDFITTVLGSGYIISTKPKGTESE